MIGNVFFISSSDSERVDSQMHPVECTSVSECEIDVSGAHILNRLEIFDQSGGGHANPGIASIWNDERCRRSQMKGDVRIKFFFKCFNQPVR